MITNIYVQANFICICAKHKSNNQHTNTYKNTLNCRHLGLLCDRIILDDNKRH